jgi:hypothetical protein
MEHQQEQQNSLELTPQLVTMMTTEHYTLQSGQAQEVADINGRNTLFIGAVSSTLIALAFIGQISHLGTAFFVFSLVLFPSLFFLGLVTFEWALQATNTIIIYGRGINRIRHLYLEYAPQMQPYFILSSHDDAGSVLGAVAIRRSPWQVLFAPPGMIAVINSVLVGVFVGLLLSALFSFSLPVCTSAGVLIFLLSLSIHLRYYWAQVKRRDRNLPVHFPTQTRQ